MKKIIIEICNNYINNQIILIVNIASLTHRLLEELKLKLILKEMKFN